jgi:putative glutamine amidotransferase
VIEAIEGTSDAFVLGVQGHPEALQATADQRWQALFRAFVRSCAQGSTHQALAAD